MDARQRRLALLAAIMGSFVVGLDATVVNVALPAIEAELGGGLAGQQWVANAYRLGMGSAAVLVGLGGVLALVDIRDPRRPVRSADCAGGQLAGQPLDAARPRADGVIPAPARVTAGGSEV